MNNFRLEQLLKLVGLTSLTKTPELEEASGHAVSEAGSSEIDANVVPCFRTAPSVLPDVACCFAAASDLRNMRWNPGGFSAFAAQKINCERYGDAKGSGACRRLMHNNK
jgi:hypothetical protein